MMYQSALAATFGRTTTPPYLQPAVRGQRGGVGLGGGVEGRHARSGRAGG